MELIEERLAKKGKSMEELYGKCDEELFPPDLAAKYRGDDGLGTTDGATLLARSKADAAATAVSVDFGLTGVGLSAGAALSRADTTADADATGLAGGAGNDRVAHAGEVVRFVLLQPEKFGDGIAW